MKIVLMFVAVCLCMSLSAQSQSDVQIMDGRQLYSDTTRNKNATPSKSNTKTYKVETGDSWNSIAAKFGVTYSQLRLVNAESDKLLAGKTINIPTDKIKIDDPYFEKKHLDSEADNSVEKYHVVQSGQTLYSISTKYGVSVDKLKEWNKLTSNSIAVGQKLVVGFDKKEKPAESKTPQSASGEVRVESKKPVQKEVEADVPKAPSKSEPPSQTAPNQSRDPLQDGNIVFASTRRSVSESGIALIIDDEDSNTEKYYAFHSSAPIGTIIRITNKSNSRRVYVKVVGQFSNAGNEKAIIRISKASAEKLVVTDSKIEVDLLYGVDKE